METLKELFIPKSFNSLSLVVVIGWVAIGVILLGIFTDIEANEQSSFHCRVKGEEKDYIQGLQCFDDYQTKFTRGFPLYGFVLLNFLLIGIVCLFYSQLVKAQVQNLESEDEEMRIHHSPPSRRIFFSYCCQLAIRLSLGILFLILQTPVVYPLTFPSQYDCTSSRFKQAAKHSNITSTTRNITGTLYDCHNSLASKKTFLAIFLFAVNVVFAVVILIELIYVITKAKKDSDFTKDSEFFKIHLLSKDNNTVNIYIEETKNNIKHQNKLYETLLSNKPGEQTETFKLDEMYTNLIIYLGRAKYEFSDKRHEILEGYIKSQEKHESIDKLVDIFVPSRDNPNEVPLNIMIVGRPGIGKTLLCQKILRDCACDEMFNGETGTGKYFKFVYLYKFRLFNGDEKLNLKQLLGKCEFAGALHNEVFLNILNNPKKVLVVFDGLDEFVDKSNFVEEEEKFGNDHTETIPFSALYAKLSLGKLLKGATIVTTSRPTALSFVGKIQFDKTIEILGFNSKQIETYVAKFFSQDDSGRQTVWNHISTNANLLSLCYVPINCHIVCFSLQERLKSDKEHDYLPITITEIYKYALKLIICKHNQEYRNKISEQEELLSSDDFTPKAKAIFKNLGEIAYRGIEEGRLIFESKEVKGQEESGLLHRLPDHKRTGQIIRKPQFCFLHLTLQEFLAACYIVETKKDDLQSWIFNHISEGKWQTVIPFVAGLLHDEDESNIKIFTDLLPASPFKERDVICWPVTKDRGLVLMLFKCIFEISRSLTIDEKVIGVEARVDLIDLQITDADLPALAYVLQKVKSIHTFNVEQNYISPLGCLEICKMLKMSNLTTLYIAHNMIGDDGLKHLSNALSKNECKLTTLDISYNQIGGDGVKHLSDALSKNECKLTTLDISYNQISDDGLKHLSDALSTNKCKLTTLDISHNEIGDDGLKHLSDALSKNECKLTTLDISHNIIYDDGLKHLSDALSKYECKLTKLNIRSNEISDGLKYLSDALSKNECKLTTLDISRNNICNDGPKYLSDALSKYECKLTTLDIRQNRIDDDGLKHLSDALSKNECKLTTLYIGTNIINDMGLKHLSVALSKNECKLTTLDISRNEIGDDGLKYLSDALSKNECKLTTLNISSNKVGDDGLKYLCDALSKNECKLTTLNIGMNNIRGDGLKHLSDALSKNECKLTTLDIRNNRIGDDGLKELSDVCSKPECKLTNVITIPQI